MFFRRLSLRWQMILVIVCVPLLFLLPVFGFAAGNYRTAYREARLGKAEVIAQQLRRTVEGIAPYVTSIYDVKGLDLQVRVFAEGEPDLAFAALVLDDGEVVYHSVYGLNGSTLAELADLGEGGVVRRILPNYGPVYLTALKIDMPFGDGRALYAVVGQPESAISPPISILLPVLIGVLAAALMVALMQFFMARMVVRPLHQLAEGAAIVGGGDLSYDIATEREDEIGALSRAFVQMTGRLRETVVGLEQQVAERTAALERKSSQFQAANMVAREAARVQDVPTLLETAVTAISEYFGFYHAGIFLLDEAHEWAVLRAASSEGGRQMLTRRHRLRVGSEGIVGVVATTGLPRIALDVGDDAAWFNSPDLPGTRSEIGLPLKIGDNIIGVLDVQSEEEAAFKGDDVENLQLLADQVALALQNAQLLEQMQGAVGELESLQQDYRTAGWARLMMRQRPLAYEYDRVQVYPVPPLPTPPDFIAGASHHETVRDAGTEVFMEAMRAHGQVIGLMALTDPERVWSQEEVALVESVGEQVGLALENARLFEDAQRTARQQALINFVLQVAATTMEPEEALREIARVLAQGLGMAVGVFTFPDPEVAIIQLQSFLSAAGQNVLPDGNFYTLAPDLYIFFRGLTEPALGRMLQTPHNELLGRTYDLDRILYVPIRTATAQKGIMAMVQRLDDPPLDPDTRELARNLAGQIAVILENMSLLEETQRRSAELQALYEISLRFSAELDTAEILRLMVNQSITLFAAEAGGFFEYQAAEGALVLTQATDALAWRLDARIKADSSVGAQMLSARKPVVLDGRNIWDTDASGGLSRPVLAVPVAGRTGTTGILATWGGEKKATFDDRDIRLAELFITQVVAALENARLYEASTSALAVVEKQARYQTNVAQAVALLAEQQGAGSIGEVLRLLGDAAKVRRAFYFETQSSDRGLVWHMAAQWGAEATEEEGLVEQFQFLPVERFQLWKRSLIEAGLVAGQSYEMPPTERRILKALQISSFLVLAVPGEHAVPGFLGFVEVGASREWTAQEVAALQTAAAALSSTLARDRLFRQVEANLAETETLYQASAALTRANTYEDVLEVVRLRTALGQKSPHNVSLHLFDTPWTEDHVSQWSLVAARWLADPREKFASRYPVAIFPSAVNLLRMDGATQVENVATDPRLDEVLRQFYIEQMRARSVLIVPLVVGGLRIGYFFAVYAEITTFTEAELRQLMALSGQAAVAIQNIIQLEATTARARRERQIREVVGQIQAAPDVQSVLQTAVRELGRALGAPRSFVQLLRREGGAKKPGTGELSETASAAALEAEDDV